MLEMGEHGAWVPPVLKTVARTGEGLPALRAELARHREHLSGPAGAARGRADDPRGAREAARGGKKRPGARLRRPESR